MNYSSQAHAHRQNTAAVAATTDCTTTTTTTATVILLMGVFLAFPLSQTSKLRRDASCDARGPLSASERLSYFRPHKLTEIFESTGECLSLIHI